jgi:hypothetical protein
LTYGKISLTYRTVFLILLAKRQKAAKNGHQSSQPHITENMVQQTIRRQSIPVRAVLR